MAVDNQNVLPPPLTQQKLRGFMRLRSPPTALVKTQHLGEHVKCCPLSGAMLYQDQADQNWACATLNRDEKDATCLTH